jgi:hypothetical protein
MGFWLLKTPVEGAEVIVHLAVVQSCGLTQPSPSTPMRALTQAQEYAEIIQTKWEETEEKPAVIAISIAAFVAIWAASGVIVSASRTPVSTFSLCAYNHASTRFESASCAHLPCVIHV